VLACVYVCRLSVFMCVYLVLCVLWVIFFFFVFVCFCGGSDSLAPNEDIVRLKCGRGEAILPAFEKKLFFSSFGDFCTILIDLDLLYLDC